jgi:hypothetical protein
MKFLWKTYLVKIKRYYNIIFNTRDIEIIRSDYFDKKWISKEEMHRLIEHEEKSFIRVYGELQTQYQDLLQFFNTYSPRNIQETYKK